MRAVALCILALGVACSSAVDTGVAERTAPPPELPPSEPFSRSTVTLSTEGMRVRVPVYVADTPALQRRGLMGREDLPDGSGMVFVFPAERTGGFWMKDTLIPLSIAFADVDGTIVAALDMEPCRADPCPVYDPQVSYATALEVEQGFFDEIGLEPGWRLELPPS